jgi:FkbM family methyltransferase
VKADERASIDIFSAFARESDRVLDIGANSGMFSLAAVSANPSVRVRAFEIVPELFTLLQKNVLRNDFAANIDCRLRGVGEPGFTMVVPPSFDSSSLPTSVSSLDKYDSGVTVGFDSLDSLCADYDASDRVLIKIDVEGTEDHVFRWGGRVLSTHKPDILCELLVGTNTEHLLMEMMSKYGYRFFKVCDGKLEQFERITPDTRFHDWFFSARELSDIARIAPGFVG